MKTKKITAILIVTVLILLGANISYCQDDDSTRRILREGLLGAGTGAIAAGASGGKAGQGALIGAGTAVIGSALLDAMTAPPRSQRSAAPPAQGEYYYADEPDYYYEEEPVQQSSSGNVIKQGLLGAGTGAIAAGASGGNAGQGALIGAGTGVIGGALLDAATQPAPQRRKVYRRPAPAQTQTTTVAPQNVQVEQLPDGSRKKVIKKYDASGKLVSEEEIYY